MGDVPDAAAATNAVAALHEQITDAYRRATAEGGDADLADAVDWAQLASDVIDMDAQVRWIRDAVLVLARQSGASWPQLQRVTGVSDATLSNRARRRLEKDQ